MSLIIVSIYERLLGVYPLSWLLPIHWWFPNKLLYYPMDLYFSKFSRCSIYWHNWQNAQVSSLIWIMDARTDESIIFLNDSILET